MRSKSRQRSEVIEPPSLSAEKRALIDGAAQHGARVTSKQIDRWRLDGVLPKAAPHGRGKGRGVARVSPEATLRQLVALVSILRQNRSLDHAALRLWLGGFSVPITRVRRALASLVARPWKTMIDRATDRKRLDAEAARFEETILRRKRAPKATKRLARQQKLAPLFSMLLGQTLGSQPPDQERLRSVMGVLEEATGIANARREEPGHTGTPWLKDDITEEVSFAISVSAELGSYVEHASDEQLEQARKAFLNVEKIFAWSQYAKRAYGHAFGMEALEGSWFDGTGDEAKPLLIAAILLMIAKYPERLPNFEMLGASAGAIVEQIEAALREIQSKQ
jgi:hypothetical protein